MKETGLVESGVVNVTKVSRKDLPDVGDWVWYNRPDISQFSLEEPMDETLRTETLMCVEHIASNHVVLTIHNSEYGTEGSRVRFLDYFANTRPENDPDPILEGRLNRTRDDISKNVKLLQEAAGSMALGKSTFKEGDSLLPSRMRVDPETYKRSLVNYRKNTLPELTKGIKELTTQMVWEIKNVALSQILQMNVVQKTLGTVEERIFNIEIYAGLKEKVTRIREGAPAPSETPLSINQTLYYMDEESLMGYEYGGMDFKSIGDFDKWLLKPENLKRYLPNPRSILAFKVRRHEKDYGKVDMYGEAVRQVNMHDANNKTYLYFRNGEEVYFLASSVDFSPRLIPLTGSLSENFVDRHTSYEHQPGYTYHDTRGRVEHEKVIDPSHLDYDRRVEDRRKEILGYNRITVLIQGLLDRSPVFNPHPPINLADFDDTQKYIVLLRTEENAIQGHNPPSWEDYRKKANKGLKKGDYVITRGDPCTKKIRDLSRRNYSEGEQLPYGQNEEPKVVEATLIRRNKTVRVSWPYGVRHGLEHPAKDGCNAWGEWGEWKVNKHLHNDYSIENVFRIDGYQLGDYKKFLCHRETREDYIKWSPTLLYCENHMRWRLLIQIISKMPCTTSNESLASIVVVASGIGNLHPETGNLHPETGNLHPETGNLHPETGNLHPEFDSILKFVKEGLTKAKFEFQGGEWVRATRLPDHFNEECLEKVPIQNSRFARVNYFDEEHCNY